VLRSATGFDKTISHGGGKNDEDIEVSLTDTGWALGRHVDILWRIERIK
jgi:hypothetical protein